MSEQVCKNCGKPEGSHPWMHGSRLCIATYFEPKPEPPKAKPGVRYRNKAYSYLAIRIGMIDGSLGFAVWTPNDGYTYTIEPMTADWVEVPE